jgi:hypothetical protein
MSYISQRHIENLLKTNPWANGKAPTRGERVLNSGGGVQKKKNTLAAGRTGPNRTEK